MLVVTSNWTWTDGSLASPPAGRGSRWLLEVHRAVLRAGFGRDGRYRPVETVDIVFAGDTFDCLTSRAWTARLRPWHGGAQVATMREQVLVEAARRGRRLLARVARWAREGLPLPPADRRGRPVERGLTRAAVRIALLAGDRDRWLEEAAGIAARHGCHVGRVWSDDATVVRHGAEFDPCWSGADPWTAVAGDRPPFLGESVLVDLVARFAAAILGDDPTVRSLRRLVGRLSAAPPLELPTLLAAWLAAGSEGAGLPMAGRRRIESEWRAAVAAWHRAARRVPPICGIEACPIDWLAGWLEYPSAAAPPADVAARFAPRPPRVVRRPAGLVLGHVGGHEGAADASLRRGQVCLASRPAAGRDPPTAVLTSRGWGWLADAPASPQVWRTPSPNEATMTGGGVVRVSASGRQPQASSPPTPAAGRGADAAA